MPDYKFTDCKYPNGTRYQKVALNRIDLGHLVESDKGFTSLGWRKPVATKEAALEKMRQAAIADRKRQIAKLQADVDNLASA